MDRINYLAAMVLLSWTYTAVFALAFWALGLFDATATAAAFALVTIATCLGADRAHRMQS